ncbi:hypothetical protein [Mesorhizobium tamadayense]|uniref:hypothetical protein n=1 Tax=Mesorhizobium tamadayense TaxID=425306 RepID=UPI00142DF23C|nr:hypothetical protein [Mesorhizobium tamadayense]
MKDNGLIRYPVALLREWIAEHTVDPDDIAAEREAIETAEQNAKVAEAAWADKVEAAE